MVMQLRMVLPVAATLGLTACPQQSTDGGPVDQTIHISPMKPLAPGEKGAEMPVAQFKPLEEKPDLQVSPQVSPEKKPVPVSPGVSIQISEGSTVVVESRGDGFSSHSELIEEIKKNAAENVAEAFEKPKPYSRCNHMTYDGLSEGARRQLDFYLAGEDRDGFSSTYTFAWSDGPGQTDYCKKLRADFVDDFEAYKQAKLQTKRLKEGKDYIHCDTFIERDDYGQYLGGITCTAFGSQQPLKYYKDGFEAELFLRANVPASFNSAEEFEAAIANYDAAKIEFDDRIKKTSKK